MQAHHETQSQKDARMSWWREARFGLFIHWGLYAIPAGKWGNQTGHGEWIRDTAHIPVQEYEALLAKFNPVKFDADQWVKMARDAGMKYIVITTKHHDGFCLFDSKQTDWDVMSTPFKRDIMKELSEACAKQGIRQCWYHSIMDWHHPDYLPRRGWEETSRPAAGAQFDKFVNYLHAQITELLTKYGPIGVMWFDGEWESTWNHEYGKPLYELCRKLQPNVIVNNRVDVGRSGMMGMTTEDDRAGDFGTPEQEVPPMGMPGVDWETCMTMNNHWGYNAYDKDFKSSRQLIRTLCDVASKGGNFLLNVGPTSEGEFPSESVQRLHDIGAWMKVNGNAIYGTVAGPFRQLSWGRCTMRVTGGNSTLYLHVFDWPKNGRLIVPVLGSDPKSAKILAEQKHRVGIERVGPDVVLQVPATAPNNDCTVIALTFAGGPVVYAEPEIHAPHTTIYHPIQVEIETGSSQIVARYTTNGSDPESSSPAYSSPLTIRGGDILKVRSYHGGKPVSGIVKKVFLPATLWPSTPAVGTKPGLSVEGFDGNWDALPKFSALKAKWVVVSPIVSLPKPMRKELFGLRFSGYINVPADDVYHFALASDDGSRLTIDGNVVVDNDGLHSMLRKDGFAPLARGLHRITIEWFNKTGGADLSLEWAALGKPMAEIAPSALCRK
jgi:alpha-L-fucosidase